MNDITEVRRKVFECDFEGGGQCYESVAVDR